MDRIVSKPNVRSAKRSSKAAGADANQRIVDDAGSPNSTAPASDPEASGEVITLGSVRIDLEAIDAGPGVKNMLRERAGVIPKSDPEGDAAIEACVTTEEDLAKRALDAVRGLAMAHPDRWFAFWSLEAAKVVVFGLLGSRQMPPPDALSVLKGMMLSRGRPDITKAAERRWVPELIERIMFSARERDGDGPDQYDPELGAVMADRLDDSVLRKVLADGDVSADERWARVNRRGTVRRGFLRLRERAAKGYSGVNGVAARVLEMADTALGHRVEFDRDRLNARAIQINEARDEVKRARTIVHERKFR